MIAKSHTQLALVMLRKLKVQGNQQQASRCGMVNMRMLNLAILLLITSLSLSVLARRTSRSRADLDEDRQLNRECNQTAQSSSSCELRNCETDQVNGKENARGIGECEDISETSSSGTLNLKSDEEDNSEEDNMHDFKKVELQLNDSDYSEFDDSERQETIKFDEANGVDLTEIKEAVEESRRAKNVSAKVVSRRPIRVTKYDRIISRLRTSSDLSMPLISSSGRYNNPWKTWRQPSAINAAAFYFENDDTGLPSANELDKTLPILTPDFNVLDSEKEGFRVTWIGHATLLIQVDGLNILTDPVFSDSVGAYGTQFFLGYSRYRRPACDIESLPNIDVVLISHNHYDHLDTVSVAQLHRRFGDRCIWLIPKGLGRFMQSMSIRNYFEMMWWQKYTFAGRKAISHVNDGSIANLSSKLENPVMIKDFSKYIDIYFTPAQHWSRRGALDENLSLWGSYTIINSKQLKFFFAGDTGYCSVFKELYQVFGPFTGAAIPIGAYKPRWFLRPQHVDPEEAAQIHFDIESKKSFAIHHATFPMAKEFYLEPAQRLREIMNTTDSKTSFDAIKHGQTLNFCSSC